MLDEVVGTIRLSRQKVLDVDGADVVLEVERRI